MGIWDLIGLVDGAGGGLVWVLGLAYFQFNMISIPSWIFY